MRAEECDETIEELADEARQARIALGSVHRPKDHAVVHLEISGPDAATLRQFYSKAFGWTLTAATPDFTSEPGSGYMQTHHGMAPYVTVYVHVDDLDGKLAGIQ